MNSNLVVHDFFKPRQLPVPLFGSMKGEWMGNVCHGKTNKTYIDYLCTFLTIATDDQTMGCVCLVCLHVVCLCVCSCKTDGALQLLFTVMCWKGGRGWCHIRRGDCKGRQGTLCPDKVWVTIPVLTLGPSSNVYIPAYNDHSTQKLIPGIWSTGNDRKWFATHFSFKGIMPVISLYFSIYSMSEFIK